MRQANVIEAASKNSVQYVLFLAQVELTPSRPRSQLASDAIKTTCWCHRLVARKALPQSDVIPRPLPH